MNSIYSSSIINFPKISDPRGNLTFIEQEKHIPFKISRVYWIYDVPGGECRGGHAFYEQKEVIIALSGSFDIFLDDGLAQKIVHLNRAYCGLYVPNMLWRRMQNFSTNAVAYVLASKEYETKDYIYNINEYKKLMTSK